MVAFRQHAGRPSGQPTATPHRRTSAAVVLAVVFTALAVFGLQPMAGADGTETLGTPSVTIAEGSGVATGGTGMQDQQPASFTVTVPAGATVKQVLLYWEGHFDSGGPDATIVINGNAVTGTLIGGPTLFFGNVQATVYRADITSLNLVAAGVNTLSTSGLDFSFRNNGAGVLAIYDDGTETQILHRDGSDLAFVNFAPPLDTTAAQTFNFTASPDARQATIDMFAASVADDAVRPNAVDITVGGVTTRIPNVFTSNRGSEFDVARLTVTVPAGATSLTVQALSVSDGTTNLPASFDWIAATLSIQPPPEGPNPGATAQAVCADGEIRVTLTNTGGTATTFDVFRGQEKLTDQPIAVAPGGSQTFDYTLRPADENSTVPLRAVAAGGTAFDLSTPVDCAEANLVAALLEECATQGNEKGILVRFTNDGNDAGTFTVTGIDPVVVGPKSSKDVFLPVAEGAPYSFKITGVGFERTIAGTRDCQTPQLASVEVCVANGTGTLVAVTNPGEEAASVTLGGETKTVPAGGRAEFVVPRAEDAAATTITATSPGNPDLQIALPVQDCVGVSPVVVEAQTVTTTTTTTTPTTTTTIPPTVAGVQFARSGFGHGTAFVMALFLVTAGGLVVVGARKRRSAS